MAKWLRRIAPDARQTVGRCLLCHPCYEPQSARMSRSPPERRGILLQFGRIELQAQGRSNELRYFGQNEAKCPEPARSARNGGIRQSAFQRPGLSIEMCRAL